MTHRIRRMFAAGVGAVFMVGLCLVAVAAPSGAESTTTVAPATSSPKPTTTVGTSASTTLPAPSTTRTTLTTKRRVTPTTVVKRSTTTLRRSMSSTTIVAEVTSVPTTVARSGQVSTTVPQTTTTVPSLGGIGSAPPVEPNTALPSDPAQTTLRWTIAGLLLLAVIIVVVTVLFWRATRPPIGGSVESGVDPEPLLAGCDVAPRAPGAMTDAAGAPIGWGKSSSSGPLIGPPRIPASEVLARPPGQQWPSNPGASSPDAPPR